MSWEKLFEKKDFDWNIKSNFLLKKKITPYKLFTAIYDIKYKNFLIFSKYLFRICQIEDGYSILDYGSGNGSLILLLEKKYNLNKVYSLEINKFLIKFQKKIFKNKINFIKTNNKDHKIKIPSNQIDVVFSNSVIQYLPSNKFVISQINEFIRVAKKRVVILDIHNIKYFSDFKKYQKKKYNLTKSQLNDKYKKTKHLYFDKNFFQFLTKNKKVISYKFKSMPYGYPGSKFGRFSCIIELSKDSM